MSCGAHSEYETLVCMGISLHVALTLGVLLGIGYVCLDVGSMSRYRICIQLKSTFGSGPDYMRKKVHVCNKFQLVSDGAKKPFCASVNTALVSVQHLLEMMCIQMI